MIETEDVTMTTINTLSNQTPERTGNSHQAPHGVYSPRADIVETDQAFLVKADLPGVKPDGVSLHCKAGELVLHARSEPRGAGKKPLFLEYGTGDYFRAFRLGVQVDCAGIEAGLSAGVLTVRIPKAEAFRPKTIAVRSA